MRRVPVGRFRSGRHAGYLATRVVGIAILRACPARDPLTPIKTSPLLERVRERVRAGASALDVARPPAPGIEAIARLIASGALEVPCAGEVK